LRGKERRRKRLDTILSTRRRERSEGTGKNAEVEEKVGHFEVEGGGGRWGAVVRKKKKAGLRCKGEGNARALKIHKKRKKGQVPPRPKKDKEPLPHTKKEGGKLALTTATQPSEGTGKTQHQPRWKEDEGKANCLKKANDAPGSIV